MTFTIEREEQHVLCAGEGALTAASTPEFARLAAILAELTAPAISLDLGRVTACDSGGLRLLYHLAAMVRRREGQVRFVALSSDLRATFRLLRLDPLIPLPTTSRSSSAAPKRRRRTDAS
jgi:anti-anti-sigma factor